MAVDYQTRKSRLGRNTGGLSGPAIKPLTLRMAFLCCQAVRIPVVGLGGIEKAEDILEYLIVGASAIQVGTAHFWEPRASSLMVEGLEKLCLKHKIHKISDIRGTFEPVLD
jgi:dihydroorotate dehydrogenase (NAD+) catalytic subunit